MGNPPVDVQQFGQSIWLDYIHRRDLENGELQHFIDEYGVVGVTSNPAIFQKAIGGSDAYDSAIKTMLELDPHDIYERLAIEDIQRATDLFRDIYERTNGLDGYVSLEVSPLLANSTEETIAEAKRLAAAVNRPNLMIKIPATPAGIPAIEEAIAAGINVNVTLIFSVQNYREVAEAYIRGLERRLEAGEDVTSIASVASFFLSRIDTLVDGKLENNIRAAQTTGDLDRVSANRELLGKAAIANAKVAYHAFQTIFEGPRFAKLHEAGARVQRPLWASTSTKNPAYPDTMYVDNLIGPHTVNTVPPNTLKAFKDHGQVAQTLTQNIDEAFTVLDKLAEVGVDMDLVTRQLQDDGVEAFIRSFEQMISQVAAKRAMLKTGIIERQKLALGIMAEPVQRAMAELDKDFVCARIWQKDGSVWKSHGATINKIVNRLGWLDVLKTIDYDRLQALQDAVRGEDVDHVVLLGMGGSSLAPEVFFNTFGQQEGFPKLIVLDSTNPARISDVEAAIDIERTLFIVASKSGGTIETMSFYRYFWQCTGEDGSRFIAITDEGTSLHTLAEERKFRDVFINPADIGGRYSALSYFGLVPAALIGLDLARIRENAAAMLEACDAKITTEYNPAASIGAVMGAVAREGRDKVTFICSSTIADFGNWLEQLIAESTGKEGVGILPVVGATVGKPHDYSSDQLFVYIKVEGDSDVEQLDAGVRALREAGHPRVTIMLPDAYALAGEFFRWEMATAIAGKMLNINPFDEPNVTEAKQATKRLLDSYTESGELPQGAVVLEAEGVRLYAEEHTRKPLRELCAQHGFNAESLVDVLAAQLIGTHAGDYFALLAYVNPTSDVHAELQDLRRRVRHATNRAVTLGYGPRYLHSTGQLHKGGPNTGVFFLLTTGIEQDLAIPDAPYSFGVLHHAQAFGDYEALNNHKRRTLRLHVEKQSDIARVVALLRAAIELVEQRKF